MAETGSGLLHGTVVEEGVELTFVELCRACRADEQQLIALVEEGVVQPSAGAPGNWRFAGHALRRAHLALRLARDLEINPPGVALALDLIDEIEELRRRLIAAGR